MSKNSVMLLYRYINKHIAPSSKVLFREEIIKHIKYFEKNEKDKLKYKEWDIFIKNYLKMKYHINKENKLLQSYNINIVRDSKKEIESVAWRVGLEI